MEKKIKLKQLILIELNEVNFDVIDYYIKKFPNKYLALEKIITGVGLVTSAEKRYEEQEPWIQWVSVHTGMTFNEHKIFRLGDIIQSNVPQFFEVLEEQGVDVGVISAMNAENRLKRPLYFIPDPWTNTPTDGSFWSEILSRAIRQTVNDNSQSHISFKSALTLLLGFCRFAKLRHYWLYFNLALKSVRASWRKALFLDLLLHDIHLSLIHQKKPGFSTIFFNAGAHIQHHYFFNAKPFRENLCLRNPVWYVSETEDPFADMLEVYNDILFDYLLLDNSEMIVATGLTQKPYDRIKYYWRLKNHDHFLNVIGIHYRNVTPLMTRDFLIEFDSCDDAAIAQYKLSRIIFTSENQPLFGEIDNRGNSLFVTLTYQYNIDEDSTILVDGFSIKIKPFTTFVAIKNGMHHEKGFTFFTNGIAKFAPPNGSHTKEIHSSVLRYFGVI